MSYVADTILTIGLMKDFDESEYVDAINGWLKENGFGTFREISEYCGGGKALQADLWVGAFNYLDVDGLVSFCRNLKWPEDATPQLFIKNENDDYFQEIKIKQLNDKTETAIYNLSTYLENPGICYTAREAWKHIKQVLEERILYGAN
ncbi:MAG: hypothetical protein ABIH23_11535 [bacterium]